METMLEGLVQSVEDATPLPLDQVAEAARTARQLGQLGDQLLDHFVNACRTRGHSWAEIGDHLGVTRQAVQRRFAAAELVAGGSNRPPGERPSVRARHRQEHRGKYRALWQWLCDQEADFVDVTFAEIEEVLGIPLPPSSRRHQPHWHSYDGSAVVRAIIDAGWRAQNVDLRRERVSFVRAGAPAAA